MTKLVVVRRGAFAVGAKKKNGRVVWMVKFATGWREVTEARVRRILPLLRKEGAS